jgi:hypothetical protein
VDAQGRLSAVNAVGPGGGFPIKAPSSADPGRSASEAQRGSISGGILRATRAGAASAPAVVSLRAGMERLPEVMAHSLEHRLHFGCGARRRAG